MPHPSKSQSLAGQPSRDWAGVVLLIAAIAGLAVAAAAGLASAKVSNPTVATAHNSRLHETVLVDRHGFTLYALSPETTHHLLCKTTACISFWPPLKASSAKAKLVKGAGIKGKLGTLQRKGFAQITLNGRPLYRFSGDSARDRRTARASPASVGSGTWSRWARPPPRRRPRRRTTTTSTNTTTTSDLEHLYLPAVTRARPPARSAPLHFVKQWRRSGFRTSPAGAGTATSSRRSGTRRWSSSSG